MKDVNELYRKPLPIEPRFHKQRRDQAYAWKPDYIYVDLDLLQRINDNPNVDLETVQRLGQADKLTVAQKVKIEVEPAPRMSTINEPFMSARDESMSMASVQSSVYQPISVGGEKMTEARIKSIPAIKEEEFLKHGGGALGV